MRSFTSGICVRDPTNEKPEETCAQSSKAPHDFQHRHWKLLKKQDPPGQSSTEQRTFWTLPTLGCPLKYSETNETQAATACRLFEGVGLLVFARFMLKASIRKVSYMSKPVMPNQSVSPSIFIKWSQPGPNKTQLENDTRAHGLCVCVCVCEQRAQKPTTPVKSLSSLPRKSWLGS